MVTMYDNVSVNQAINHDVILLHKLTILRMLKVVVHPSSASFGIVHGREGRAEVFLLFGESLQPGKMYH